MPRILVFVLLLLPALSGLALAQDGHGGEEGPVFFDPVVAPLVQPDLDDFIADDPSLDPAAPTGSVSVAAYTEVSDKLSVISLAPRLRLTDHLRARVRVPWILERKLDYFGQEATGSGLGDLSVDLSYRRVLDAGRQRLEFTASVKLPTGDDENVDDNDNPVPLGTGTVDLLARGVYARQTRNVGLLVSALYRHNTGNEVITESPSADPSQMVRYTTTTTNANQFVGAAFGRYRASEKLWVHLGAAITMTGSGESETETDDPVGGTSTSSFDLEQGSTLLDLFPGVSYSLGLVQPYLGLRIPVATSYDSDFLLEERDTAVVLQITYSPTRMFGG